MLSNQDIKDKARELGFDLCGIAKAEQLENKTIHLKSWLDKGMNAEMAYMAGHFEKRIDPTLLVPNAKSVISVAMSYNKNEALSNEDYQISSYAHGLDYHYVLKEKLKELLEYIISISPETEGRCFVDSAPVLEKAWAEHSGLGWIGKNTCLINKEYGSFIFLGELIITTETTYDKPLIKTFCGSCTRCIDACPTKALEAPYSLNAAKCLSYLTIEDKGEICKDNAIKANGCVYGCDICQRACPWNGKAKLSEHQEFYPNEDTRQLMNSLNNIDKTTFKRLIKRSALSRISYDKWISNINKIRIA